MLLQSKCARLKTLHSDAKGNVIKIHAVDVIPDAIIPDNPSHAIIVATPDYSNQRVFRRLLERLREIAERRGWMIEPSRVNKPILGACLRYFNPPGQTEHSR